MAEAFADWDLGITLRVVTKDIVDGQIEEDEKADVCFQGVLQPIPPQKLLVKPEGQRGWRWWMLHTTQYLDLDMQIIDEHGKLFRVMNSSDWQNAGYYAYELTETPG